MGIGSCVQTIEPPCPEGGFSARIRPKSAKAGGPNPNPTRCASD